MNVAVATGLLIVFAKFGLWLKKTKKCFTIHCMSTAILTYLPHGLG